jgi:transketolase C-terminal domain/subunit
MYGLRQAPWTWHAKLSIDLSKLGSNEFRHTESVFWRERACVKAFMLIHVNEMPVLTASTKAGQDVTAEISKLYTIKDLGKLGYFPGISLITCRQNACNYLNRTIFKNCLLDSI